MVEMRTIKGPAIFLAQFAGDASPYNSLPEIARWARGTATRACKFRPGMPGCSISRRRPKAGPIATRSRAFCVTPAWS